MGSTVKRSNRFGTDETLFRLKICHFACYFSLFFVRISQNSEQILFDKCQVSPEPIIVSKNKVRPKIIDQTKRDNFLSILQLSSFFMFIYFVVSDFIKMCYVYKKCGDYSRELTI